MYDTRFGYPGSFSIAYCSVCDFRQTEPILSDEELGDLYTNYYPRRSINLEKLKQDCDVRNDGTAKRRRWFSGVLYKCFYHVPPGKRVLDIGCGSAQSLLFLKANGTEAFGIEEDRNVLQVSEALHVPIEAGNIYASTYPDESFDYILASQVLEHIPDPIRFLKAAKKKLAPGGKMILSFPNTRSLTRLLFGKRWIHWHIPYHLNHFSAKSLRPLFGAAGLVYTGYKTVTPTDWTILQLRDFLMPVPKPGTAHPLWKKEPSTNEDVAPVNAHRSMTPRKIAARLFRWSLNIVNRGIDLLGYGDSFLIEVTASATIPAHAQPLPEKNRQSVEASDR